METQHEGKAPSMIELDPRYAPGLIGIEEFSHIWVISYLSATEGKFQETIVPAWDKSGKPRGIFATRTPYRPSPIGMTKARLLGVERTTLLVENLDLFDGTPILDIKPYVQTIDGEISANDGWIRDHDHLELHKKGVVHSHQGMETGHLHEAADIVFDILGAVLLLQKLDIRNVYYRVPVYVGGGSVNTSHGILEVPAPATRRILELFNIAWDNGPVQTELVTPTGAAILSGIEAVPIGANRATEDFQIKAIGNGVGHKHLEILNVLTAQLVEKRKAD